MKLMTISPLKTPAGVQITIACRLNEEDGVWNGTAIDLPVAVFGSTFEEAKKNLGEAILCHLEALAETGKIDAVIAHLQRQKQEWRLSLNDIPASGSVVRLDAMAKGNHFALAGGR